MADPLLARQNLLRNVRYKTERSIGELLAELAARSPFKTAECTSMLMDRCKLGDGDAKAVALLAGKPLPVPDLGVHPVAADDALNLLQASYGVSEAHLWTLHVASEHR